MTPAPDQVRVGARSWRRTAAFALASAVLAVSVVYVLLTFSWDALGKVLVKTDLVLFIVGGVLTILVYWLLRTLRWVVLMRGASHDASFAELYIVTALSAGLSIVTPFQSGEAGKVEWLKQKGRLDRTSGYSAFAVERLLDLAVVCAFALVGMGNLAPSRTALPWVMAVLVASIVLSILLLRVFDLGQRLGPWLGSVQMFCRDTRTLIIVAVLTVASWVVVVLGWWVSLTSISTPLDFWESTGLVGVVTLVNILSIVPGAIGVSEVGVSWFLIAIGEEPAMAQAGAIIIRGYGLLVLLLAAAHLLVVARWRKGWGAMHSRASSFVSPDDR